MALTTLAVVTDMLGLLGERRVNAIDEQPEHVVYHGKSREGHRVP